MSSDVKRLTEAELADIKEKHGKNDVQLMMVKTELGDAVFRTPTPADFDRFAAAKDGPGGMFKAFSLLARATVVYPSKDEFSDWVTKRPGLPANCGSTLLELAGITGQAEAKKL